MKYLNNVVKELVVTKMGFTNEECHLQIVTNPRTHRTHRRLTVQSPYTNYGSFIDRLRCHGVPTARSTRFGGREQSI